MDNLKAGERKESRKRLALRQHFSNYYNEVFDEFQEKKVKQMGATFDNQENLNLYKIKLRESKRPRMEELKNHLKRIRINKIRLCKEKLEKKMNVYSIAGAGVTIIEEEF